MSTPSPVAALPPRTASLLRSSVVVPSVPAIVADLVHNALDAHATAVHVSIDLDTWTIRCEDDGDGIALDELAQLSRYATSKRAFRDVGPEGPSEGATYGFRGEALESMQDVALLDMVSRARGSGPRETGHLVKRDGRVLACGVARLARPSSGTTVSVRDCYGKYPVRRRPLENASAQATLLAHARSRISHLALAHPSVSFSLVDSTLDPPKTLVSVPRSNEGVLGRWRQLWGRAGTETVWEVDLREQQDDGNAAETIETAFRAEGFISVSASHSKSSQYLLVNSRPISPCGLHKSINHLFSLSTFSRHSASHLSLPPSSPSPAKQRSASSRSQSPVVEPGRSSSARAGRNTPKRVSERFPIFCINLVVPDRHVDVTLDPLKLSVEFDDYDRVDRFVRHVARAFLEHHGFLSPAKANPTREGGIDTRSASSERQLEDLNPETPPRKKRCSSTREEVVTVFPTLEPTEDADRQVGACHARTMMPSPSPSSTEPLRYIDPNTHQAFLVDPRTGHNWRTSYFRPGPRRGNGDGIGEKDALEDLGTEIVDRSRLKRTWKDDATASEAMPEWLSETLANWSNPVFPSAKPVRPIPSLRSFDRDPASTRSNTLSTAFSVSKPSVAEPPAKSVTTSSTRLTHARLGTLSQFFASSTSVTSAFAPPVPNASSLVSTVSTPLIGSQSFSREALGRADFIAQVDDKFLLARLALSTDQNVVGAEASGSTLVLFDQHAVSERIRVEKLFSQLFEIERDVARGPLEASRQVVVVEGKRVVVSREEADEVERWQAEFARWGISIEPRASSIATSVDGNRRDDAAEPGDYVQLSIRTVPRVVASRLEDERALQEVVRGYLAQLRDGGPTLGRSPVSSSREHDATTWTARLRACPVGLVDLVNSKACRGAVMFNDPLRPDQARSLLTALADTRFPFQCAHGRPSIVPVLNLPASTRRGQADVDPAARHGKSAIDWTKLG
ncbi:hypothetical protein JCM10212_002052 [Sporobolomyces blumeae]